MNIREWALILFTILAQLSVGSFLVLGFVHFFAARKVGVEEADRLSDRALLAIGPVMILAMAGSLLHLGDPLNAPRAVVNLGTSWLSREILSVVVFTVLGGAFAIMQWRKWGSAVLRNVIAWLAALAGLVLVFSMSRVYMLPTQPAWNTFATPVSFFTTTVLLGVLAMGAAFVASYTYLKGRSEAGLETQLEMLRSTMRWIAVVAILMLGVEFVVEPLRVAFLAAGVGAALESARLLIGSFSAIFVLRLVLAFLGAGVLGVFLYQSALSPGRERAMSNFAYGAFVLVLVAEVLGRYLFYATQVRVGI